MEKQKLLEFLACPVCQAPLTEFSACAACGEAFSEDDGTPNFMPSRGTRTVSFSYTPQRSTVDDATLRSFFKFPPRHGEDKALPFRMDAAFGDLIETLPQGSTMLEIGCGGGQVRQWTEDKGLQYVGTDISKIRIPELLQAHGGPDLLSDAHFLAFRDERFDVVYASAVMEHLACPALAVQ
ncbi:MAG: methyltransferase domain-containing protein, partial [Pseudomonadota bacterium]